MGSAQTSCGAANKKLSVVAVEFLSGFTAGSREGRINFLRQRILIASYVFGGDYGRQGFEASAEKAEAQKK